MLRPTSNVHMDFFFSERRYIFDNTALAHNVFDCIIHEHYNRHGFSNDIAIVMILDTFEFSTYVNKANLTNSLDWMDENINVMAAGWGELKVRKIMFGMFFEHWLSLWKMPRIQEMFLI